MPTSPVSTRPTPLAWGLLVILALTWGCSFMLVKKALVGFTAPQVGGMRIFAAFLFFLPILIAQRKHLPTRDRWGWCLLAGLLGNLIPALLFAAAGQELSSSVSGILNSFTPLFVLVVGVLFFKNKVRADQIVGMVFGLLGCALIILVGNGGGFSLNGYALLVVLATVCYGFNLHVVRTFLSGIPSLALTAAIFATIGPLAGLLLLGTGDFLERAARPEALQPLVYAGILGVVGSGVAMILFNRLLQMTSAVFASSVTYLIPVVAVGWGLLDGEHLSLQQLLGMAVILVGVYLVNRPAPKRVAEPVEVSES
ncbi:MAG: DMT family transporter [Sphingobacteriaceae bacterium]|nr:DMT family transporter [Cytophagaceae bacterium]